MKRVLLLIPLLTYAAPAFAADAVECDPQDQYNRPLTIPNAYGPPSHPNVRTVDFWCVRHALDSLDVRPFAGEGGDGGQGTDTSTDGASGK